MIMWQCGGEWDHAKCSLFFHFDPSGSTTIPWERHNSRWARKQSCSQFSLDLSRWKAVTSNDWLSLSLVRIPCPGGVCSCHKMQIFLNLLCCALPLHSLLLIFTWLLLHLIIIILPITPAQLLLLNKCDPHYHWLATLSVTKRDERRFTITITVYSSLMDHKNTHAHVCRRVGWWLDDVN